MSKAQLATEFQKAEDSPGFLLWQLSNKWQAKQRVALKAFDLTHVQFVLLATLTFTANKASLMQKQLAEYAQTDVMMTSQVLRKLEEKGLVRREPNRHDKRAIDIRPTPAGVRLVNQAIKEVEAVDSQFFGMLRKRDLVEFIKTMRDLVE